MVYPYSVTDWRAADYIVSTYICLIHVKGALLTLILIDAVYAIIFWEQTDAEHQMHEYCKIKLIDTPIYLLCLVYVELMITTCAWMIYYLDL